MSVLVHNNIVELSLCREYERRCQSDSLHSVKEGLDLNNWDWDKVWHFFAPGLGKLDLLVWAFFKHSSQVRVTKNLKFEYLRTRSNNKYCFQSARWSLLSYVHKSTRAPASVLPNARDAQDKTGGGYFTSQDVAARQHQTLPLQSYEPTEPQGYWSLFKGL